MAGGEVILGLLNQKDSSWYTAWDHPELCVPVGGGESPQDVPGYWETFVCLVWRMSSVVGSGASQSGGVCVSVGAGSSSSGVADRDSRASSGVWGCEPV